RKRRQHPDRVLRAAAQLVRVGAVQLLLNRPRGQRRASARRFSSPSCSCGSGFSRELLEAATGESRANSPMPLFQRGEGRKAFGPAPASAFVWRGGGKSSRLKPLVCCCLSGWRDQSRIWPELGTDRGRPRPAPHHGAYQESIGLLHQDRRALQASATVSPDKPIHPSLEALTWQCRPPRRLSGSTWQKPNW